MSESCRNCHHWLPYPKDAGQGENMGICRRYPPKLSSDVRSSAMPTTAGDTWCGEWKPLQPEGKP